MSGTVLVGYLAEDHEGVAMDAFFRTWKSFNRKLDRTITGVTPSLHDRVGLFHAYVAWSTSPDASENLIV